MNIKTGYVSIIGKPNSGKSTLLNSFLGQKISITNYKPQTTRKKILAVDTTPDYQIIFLDTPGIIKPSYKLQEKMMEEVNESVIDADVIVIVIDVSQKENIINIFDDEEINKILHKKSKVIVVLNKVDLSNDVIIKEMIEKISNEKGINNIIPLSAKLNFNIISLKEKIIELLPEGPKLYPDDYFTDKNERFFVTEIIRDKILELYDDEIPYSCEVIIEEFKERSAGKDFISAVINVERESQKPIILGKNGNAIKKLGEYSRKAIEIFLEKQVYLQLHVKVNDKWRSNEKILKSFGYGKKTE